MHEAERLGDAYPHATKLNDTEWGYVLDLDFGRPVQWVNNDTFLIDTTSPVLVTATTNCTKLVRAWDYPVYNMTASKSFNSTGKTVDLFLPSSSASFSSILVKDQICLAARLFRSCATDVEFHAIVDSNEALPDGLNIFGLGPVSETEGPAFIQALADQGFIEDAIAVVNIVPHKRNWKSSLTLGGIPPEIDGAVRSDWFHHSYKLKTIEPYTEPIPVLDFTKVIYGNHTLFKS